MVYLLHFDRPYKHVRHYMGSTDDLDARIKRHKSGDGARLIEVITKAGISFVVAQTWPGGRDVERRLKRWKNHKDLCPICRAREKD